MAMSLIRERSSDGREGIRLLGGHASEDTAFM